MKTNIAGRHSGVCGAALWVCLAALVIARVGWASPSEGPVLSASVRALFPTMAATELPKMQAVLSQSRRYGHNRRGSSPSALTHGGVLDVIVISDLNASYGSTTYGRDVHRAVREIIRRRPDLVICTGDMVAGQHHGLDYRAMWQGFHKVVTLPLERAGIPLLVTPGNHDGPHSSRYAYQRAIYVDEWQHHRPKVHFVDDTHYPAYYSVAMGPAFLIAIDSSTVGALNDAQMHWLERQLQKAQDYPVKVVFGHVPQWALSRGREREVIGDAALVQLFTKYTVDAFLTGHDHAYYPGARGTVRYIGMPALGSGPRALLAPDQARSPRGFVEFFASPSGGIYDVESWKAGDFTRVDRRDALPEKVGTSRGPVVRDDLLGFDRRSVPFDRKAADMDAVHRHTKSQTDASMRGSSKRRAHGERVRRPRRALPADLFK